ncbi:bifunctional alpha,alpha-trehalose-phosphate synthase (UDP-forming)/trehalose-phosphatase [Sphingobacterium hungaricum]
MLKKRTIIISNRLPIRIEKQHDTLEFLPSEGGLATGLGSIYKQDDNIWIGWPGYIPENENEKILITEKLAEFNLIPVFLTAEELEGYYEGFSNEILWPIFHDRLPYAIFDKEYWRLYKQVNQKFCEATSQQQLTLKDEIWIHDYQLMLLPQMIREQHELISIGYFQHIPFPSEELFRCIPWRDEILSGLLGADIVGFHTYNDTKNFLNSCLQILNLPNTNNSVISRDRQVFVEVFPMGIDFDKFDSLAQTEAVQKKANEIKNQFKDLKIILSIDRLDYSKGIIERLQGFETLLQKHPELREQIVLYMLVVPSRDTVPQYKALRDEIDRMVGHINAVYGFNSWTPIAYFYNSFPLENLSALYVAADVCLVSSLKDGMNLVCKEYIASKAHRLDGVLILSELAGAAKELTDSININPYSVDSIASAIHLAIHMPVDEQRKRMKKSVEIVKKFNVFHWVKIFFNRLREVKTRQKKHTTRKIQGEVKESLLAQFKASKRRLFFLDYDGTLIGFQQDAEAAIPTDVLHATLNKLQSPDENQIVIISGRPHTNLDDWFGKTSYFLVAEHGAWSNYPDQEWHPKNNLSTRWKIPVKRMMSKMTNLTPGASIEEKTYSLAWHYRRVQAGLGQMRSEELVDSLHYLLPQYGLQLLMGDNVIEVKSTHLNKGKAAVDIVAEYQPDFIFAIGDDSTDEDMFYELPENAVTVKVGNKKSKAHYYVESQEEAVELISYFASSTELNTRLNTKDYDTQETHIR